MATSTNYPELVAQAEKAVAGVKDPELKRIAFQKILDDMLGGSTPSAARLQAPSKKRAAVGDKAAKQSTKGGPLAYVEELIEDGFFKKPKTIAQVKAELENRGHHIPLTSLSGPLQKLCQRRSLRRQRIKASGKKQTFAYSHW